MAGIFSILFFCGLLAAAPGGGFTFDGPEVIARTTSSAGFFIQGPTPLDSQTERGTGSAVLEVEDRIQVPRATYGDSGRLDARFRIGGTEYSVVLSAVGFPPPQALAGVSGPLPRRLEQPVGGGVMLDVDLHGTSGLGFVEATRVHAAAALWGIGRVLRNGQQLTDTAIIHAAALTAGARSDDDAHTVLAAARPGDQELHVLAWNLPYSAEPRGFVAFAFDDVSIDWNGVRLPAVASLPSEAGTGEGALASNTPVTGGSSGLVLGSTTSVGAEASLPFLNEGRVSVAVGQPTPVIPGTPTAGDTDLTGVPADPFLNPGRLAFSTQQPGMGGETVPPGTGSIETPSGTSPLLPDPFMNPGRMTLTGSGLPPTVGGLGTFGLVPLEGTGSFVVLPLPPAISGPSFNFGAASSDLVVSRTPPLPGTSPAESPAVPLVATPQPLNAQPPVPLVSSPALLNAQMPVPLVSTPTPLNAQPLASTPGGVPGAPASTAPTTSTTPAPGATPGAASGGAAAPAPAPAP